MTPFERFIAAADAMAHAALFFAIGAMIGIAQIWSMPEPSPLRLMFARAITVGGLASAAGAVLIWIPDTPLLGQIGLAAALASLGVSGLERLFARVINRGEGGDSK